MKPIRRAANYVAISGLCVIVLAGCMFARVSQEDLEPLQPRVEAMYPEALAIDMYSTNDGEGLTHDTVQVYVDLDDLKKYDEESLDKIREFLSNKFPENRISINLSFPSDYNSITYADGAYTEEDLLRDTERAFYDSFGDSPSKFNPSSRPGYAGDHYYEKEYRASVEFTDYQVTGADLYNYVSAIEDLPLPYSEHQIVFDSDYREGDYQDILNAEGVESRQVDTESYCIDFGKGEYLFTEYKQTLHVIYWDDEKCLKEKDYVPNS